MMIRWFYILVRMSVRPAKIAQSDQSSLCTQWVAKDLSFLHADSEDSDQSGRMPRLIWVFAGRTCRFDGFVMSRLISISAVFQSYRDKRMIMKSLCFKLLLWSERMSPSVGF